MYHTTSAEELEALVQNLDRLHAEELKVWMLENLIPLPPYNRRKKRGTLINSNCKCGITTQLSGGIDMILAIVNSEQDKIPVGSDVERIITQVSPFNILHVDDLSFMKLLTFSELLQNVEVL